MVKYFSLFIAGFLLIYCNPSKKIGNSDVIDTLITDEEVTAIIDTLSSDYFEGRGFATPGIEKAAQFIENYLQKQNIKPFFESYRDSFIYGERIGYNIIGLIEGNDNTLKNQYIILSAHYDHIGKIKDLNDSIRNGANDNASGVSAVLNIAKYLTDNKLNKRSVIVALFSAEELGLVGADRFSEKMMNRTSEIYIGINIDMIGSILTDQPGKVYLSGEDKSNMRNIFNKYIGSEEITSPGDGLFFDVFALSDNYPLYQNLKIPAHTFCTFDFTNYKHYHKVSDEIQNLDIDNTGIIVRNIAKGLLGILNSIDKEVVLTENKEHSPEE